MKGNNPWMNNMVGSAAEMTAVKAADGDMILKGKIQEMTNPNTTAQQAVRNPFTYYAQAGSKLLAFINQFFEKPGPMQSPYNGFVSASLKEELQEQEGTDTEVEYSQRIVPTNGPLYDAGINCPTPGTPATVDGSTTEVDLQWNYDAQSQIQDGTDELHYLKFNGDTQDWETGTLTEVRADGSAAIVPSIPASGWVLYVFFFVSVSTGETHFSMPLFQVDDQGNVLYAQDDWA